MAEKFRHYFRAEFNRGADAEADAASAAIML